MLEHGQGQVTIWRDSVMCSFEYLIITQVSEFKLANIQPDKVPSLILQL